MKEILTNDIFLKSGLIRSLIENNHGYPQNTGSLWVEAPLYADQNHLSDRLTAQLRLNDVTRLRIFLPPADGVDYDPVALFENISYLVEQARGHRLPVYLQQTGDERQTRKLLLLALQDDKEPAVPGFRLCWFDGRIDAYNAAVFRRKCAARLAADHILPKALRCDVNRFVPRFRRWMDDFRATFDQLHSEFIDGFRDGDEQVAGVLQLLRSRDYAVTQRLVRREFGSGRRRRFGSRQRRDGYSYLITLSQSRYGVPVEPLDGAQLDTLFSELVLLPAHFADQLESLEPLLAKVYTPTLNRLQDIEEPLNRILAPLQSPAEDNGMWSAVTDRLHPPVEGVPNTVSAEGRAILQELTQIGEQAAAARTAGETMAERRQTRQAITNSIRTVADRMTTLVDREIRETLRDAAFLTMHDHDLRVQYSVSHEVFLTAVIQLAPALWGLRTYFGFRTIPNWWPALLFARLPVYPIWHLDSFAAQVIRLLNFYQSLEQVCSHYREAMVRFQRSVHRINRRLPRFQQQLDNMLQELRLSGDEHDPEVDIETLALSQLQRKPAVFASEESICIGIDNQPDFKKEHIDTISTLIANSVSDGNSQGDTANGSQLLFTPSHINTHPAWQVALDAVHYISELRQLWHAIPHGDGGADTIPFYVATKSNEDPWSFSALLDLLGKALVVTGHPLRNTVFAIKKPTSSNSDIFDFIVTQGKTSGLFSARQKRTQSGSSEQIGLNTEVYYWLAEQSRQVFFQTRSGITRETMQSFKIDIRKLLYGVWQSNDYNFSPLNFDYDADKLFDALDGLDFDHDSYGCKDKIHTGRLIIRDSRNKMLRFIFRPVNRDDAEMRWHSVSALKDEVTGQPFLLEELLKVMTFHAVVYRRDILEYCRDKGVI